MEGNIHGGVILGKKYMVKERDGGQIFGDGFKFRGVNLQDPR